MTRFTLEGIRAGEPLTLVWQDGEGFGPPLPVAIVHALAEFHEGRRIALAGCPGTTHDHLKSPYGARELMERLYPRLPTMHGSLPPLPVGGKIVRHDRLGGLLHEYNRAA